MFFLMFVVDNMKIYCLNNICNKINKVITNSNREIYFIVSQIIKYHKTKIKSYIE